MVVEGGRAAAPTTAREERARELLLAHLTEEQARTYVAEGWFRVDLAKPVYSQRQRTTFRSFCLHRGRDSVIFTLNAWTGEHEKQLCTHVRDKGTWPVDDIMVAHKLMLENGPGNLLTATWCDCWPRIHQPPDLRGPLFDMRWCREPLPPEPRSYDDVMKELQELTSSFKRLTADGNHGAHEVRGLRAFFDELDEAADFRKLVPGVAPAAWWRRD